jgi:hypothetical protein
MRPRRPRCLLRPDAMPLYVPAVSLVLGADLLSEGIAWWGQGYGGFSHADAILPTGEYLGARSDHAGGKPPGVQVRPPRYERWKRQVILELPFTAEQTTAWLKFLMSQEGLGYDQGDILGLIIGRPLMTAGHWICSALQFDAVQHPTVAWLPADLPVIPQQVSPNGIFLAFSVAGARVTYSQGL